MSGPAGGAASGAPSGALLAEALAYVGRWRGRAVVVKVSGGLVEGGLAGTLAGDLALLHRAGIEVVVVHGGGATVTRLAERLGRQPTFVDGLRVTDDATMELVEMALGGGVNTRLTAGLQAAGAPAAGVSGLDGGLLRAAPHPAAATLGRVGRVEGVDPTLARSLLAEGFLPVVSPVAGDGEGRTYNVNADEAAAALAGALGAEKLVLLTDVDGVYRDGDRGDGPVAELDPAGARDLVARGVADRGMAPKLEACLAALEAGVGCAHVVGGATPHAVLLELFTDAGVGTMIRRQGDEVEAAEDAAEAAGAADTEAASADHEAAPTGPRSKP